MSHPTETEAREALQGIEQARQRVIDQVGMPWWYWWGLAAGWVGLGVLVDLGAPWWLVMAATLAVGIGHSTVSQRVCGGRQRTGGLRVGADVTGRHAELRVIGFLLALVAVTTGTALLLSADGAGHPATWASVIVAILLLLGGPRVMAWIRADATRRAASR
jgi:hypothetical protein